MFITHVAVILDESIADAAFRWRRGSTRTKIYFAVFGFNLLDLLLERKLTGHRL